MLLVDDLVRNVYERYDEVAVVECDTGKSVTFGQIAALAAGIYHRLKTVPEPRVGILLPAGAGYIAAFYAALAAGKSVVPVNFLLGGKEIAHVIKDSGVSTLVTAPALWDRLTPTLPTGTALPTLLDLATVAPADPRHITLPADFGRPDDLAVLLYTSATTGLPKGVRLTFGNLSAGVDGCIARAGLKTEHIFLGLVPLFHSFGLAALMLAPMHLGAKVVHLSRFAPSAVLKAIREHRVSLMFAVPSMFGMMLRAKDAAPEDFASMYALISGGEPLPAAVREGFLHRFHVPLLEGYGLTETAPVLTFNTPADHRPGSVGKPVHTVQVRIAAEGTEALRHGGTEGVEGEVQVRGPMVFGGYHGLPEATAAAFTPDGFFRTGDLGHLDPDGFLFITGRLKDLIISSGEKVHPREIEEVLSRHPSVAEAAVVAKRDDTRGEVPVAYVLIREGVAPPDDTALKSFCRDQGLANWQIPKEFTVLDTLPRSPTGKVLKRDLARLANPPTPPT